MEKRDYSGLEIITIESIDKLRYNITIFFGVVKMLAEKARIELLKLLAESDEDIIYGRVTHIQNTFSNLRKILKERDYLSIIRGL